MLEGQIDALPWIAEGYIPMILIKIGCLLLNLKRGSNFNDRWALSATLDQWIIDDTYNFWSWDEVSF